MPIVFLRYSRRGNDFHEFLHSDQLDDAVTEACRDIIALAVPGSRTLAAGWYQERGPNVRIGAFSRLSRTVRNDHRAAASIEFGSGRGNWRGGGERRQGGSSDPQRILGKAGSIIGERMGEPG